MSIQKIEYFLLNTWFWGMTWGIYHITINILVMLVLLKFVGKFKIVSSVTMSFFSTIFSSALYTLLAFLLVYVLRVPFVPIENVNSFQNIDVLLVCIYLGLVYALFQSLFFLILNKFYALNMGVMVLISFMSNMITALFMYWVTEIT